MIVINSSKSPFRVGLTYITYSTFPLGTNTCLERVKQHTANRSGDEKYDRDMTHKEGLA